MPNHVSNRLKVVGTVVALAAFKEKARRVINNEGKEFVNIFSLEALVPMPPELHEVTSPVRIVSQAEYDKAMEENAKTLAKTPSASWMLMKPLTKKMSAGLIKKYGVNNWYDWANKHWGTKWETYDVSEEWIENALGEKSIGFGEQTMAVMATDSQIECFYQTAWSPPSDALATISKMFPDLTFYNAYADEGGNFIGFTIFNNGVVQDQELPASPWDGKAQVEFRRMCGQTIYEDEESDEDEQAQLTE